MRFAALLAVLLCFPIAAVAGGYTPTPPSEIPDAEALIEGCWKISLEDRSSTTAASRRGHAKTLVCLEQVFLDQMEILFPDGEIWSREEAQEKLEALRHVIQPLYWSIYNESAPCWCGSQWHTIDLWRNNKFLEEMIRDIIAFRKDYRF